MITDETLMMDLQQISNISQKYPKVSKSFQKYVKIPNDSKIYKDDQGWSRMIKDDQRIVVGNWFCQYFSIKLKNMTYIQREHIPL